MAAPAKSRVFFDMRGSRYKHQAKMARLNWSRLFFFSFLRQVSTASKRSLPLYVFFEEGYPTRRRNFSTSFMTHSL